MKGDFQMSIQPFCANDDIKDVIERYTRMVYGIALTHVKNQADADDVFQDVFLIYFQKNKAFNSEEHRKAWLINTALNCCRKIINSTWRKKTVPFEEQSGKVFQFTLNEENLVFIALQELPQKYRIVLYLFYYEEFSIDEISGILKIKPGTIRVQLMRGREFMRNKIKGDYFYD